ncbi:MAG TPA: molybdopterin cofactor-binding domain-containing protein, partial [Ilumatobacteraceae bacterium]
LDEIAAALGADPYQFRRGLLADGNPVLTVLDMAATAATWGGSLPAGHHQGIACHNTYGSTPVAMVAEVSVAAGVVTVHRVDCAGDCGRVVHPDMVAEQMEGGIVFGLTSLLKGEITYVDGAVQQTNFGDYPLLQLAEMPVVKVHLVDSDRAPQGVGEMAVPPIVPAVLNAVFACTGTRIRHTPIRIGDR